MKWGTEDPLDRLHQDGWKEPSSILSASLGSFSSFTPATFGYRYGRPVRPTKEPPRALLSGTLDLEAHAVLMKQRVRTMRSVCSDVGEKISRPRKVTQKTLMWDTNHHLVYCPIYKVASGTWTTNFLRLSSFNSNLPKWQRYSKQHDASESTARKMFPAPNGEKKQKKELARSTKFLVVRHPFDRIVSAYKGKISRRDAKPRFYRKLQKEIKEDYSRNKKEIKDGVPPTFEEYWRYLIDLTKGLVDPGDWRKVDCVQAYYSVCVPCDVEYDVILKLETHDDDSEFLIRQYNLTELQEPFTMWKHKSTGENQLGDYDYYVYDDPRKNPLPEFRESRKSPTKDEEEQKQAKLGTESKVDYKKSLFGQLTKSQVRALYKNYKIDFDMFGYNVTEFLEYAQDIDSEENDNIDEDEEEDGDNDEDEEEDSEDEDEEDEEDEEEGNGGEGDDEYEEEGQASDEEYEERR